MISHEDAIRLTALHRWASLKFWHFEDRGEAATQALAEKSRDMEHAAIIARHVFENCSDCPTYSEVRQIAEATAQPQEWTPKVDPTATLVTREILDADMANRPEWFRNLDRQIRKKQAENLLLSRRSNLKSTGDLLRKLEGIL